MSGLYRARSISIALRHGAHSELMLFSPGNLDICFYRFCHFSVAFAKCILSLMLCWRAIRFCWHQRILRPKESISIIVYNYPINLLCLLLVLRVLDISLYLQLEDVTAWSMFDGRRPLHSFRIALRVLSLKLFILASKGIIAPYQYHILQKCNKPIFVLPYIGVGDAKV